jgi:MFS family permease
MWFFIIETFVIGMNQLFSNFGTLLCMYLCPLLSEEYGVVFAVFSGCILNLFSFSCSLVGFFFDRHADEVVSDMFRGTLGEEEEKESLVEQVAKDDAGEEGQAEERNLIASAYDLEQFKSFTRMFWFMSVFMATIYTSVLSFVNVSVGLLSERWFFNDPRSEVRSAMVITLMMLVISVLDPVIGIITDKLGYRAIMVSVDESDQ